MILESFLNDFIEGCIKNMLFDLSVNKSRTSLMGVWWNFLGGKGFLSKLGSKGMWNHFVSVTELGRIIKSYLAF